ncbi:hypothetical protein ACP70R_036982 [Stipagrostis hirtigluma subsp. patula]
MPIAMARYKGKQQQLGAVEMDSLHEGMDIRTKISRPQFEDIRMDLFCKCMEPVVKCVRVSKIGRSGMDGVVLVGASARITCVFQGKELRREVTPEEAAAVVIECYTDKVRLSRKEINRIAKDDKEYMAGDEKNKARLEAMNHLQRALYGTRLALMDERRRCTASRPW